MKLQYGETYALSAMKPPETLRASKSRSQGHATLLKELSVEVECSTQAKLAPLHLQYPREVKLRDTQIPTLLKETTALIICLLSVQKCQKH